MDTETVLAQMLPKVTGRLKALVEEVAPAERPTLYAWEERTQRGVPPRRAGGGPASAGGGAGQRAGGTGARVPLRGPAALS
jgi:hypothetical protein